MTHLAPMLVTMLLSLVFVAALLYYVHRITTLVREIGGSPTSYLAKLRVGLRAIETETGHLPRLVQAANGELTAVADGLQAVDGHLKAVLQAAADQENRT